MNIIPELNTRPAGATADLAEQAEEPSSPSAVLILHQNGAILAGIYRLLINASNMAGPVVTGERRHE